jgi:demethylmenaquinone methyltransferase/2-methoxy-6-polyprenyl-1,4-benzoquinol methylase
MFGGIAPRYDILNRFLSLGIDTRWRRRTALALAQDDPGLVLDLCGGTGDLSVAVARAAPAARVVCCDFSYPMLVRAGPKFDRPEVAGRCVRVEADALSLPFPSERFDAVTIAFGVRNLVDRRTGFREAARVLRLGGRLLVLEFSRPAGLFGRIYRSYLFGLIPRIGDRVSGRRGPYGYLARTISEFPEPAALAGEIRESGFAAVAWTPLTGGIVCIHDARKRGLAPF